MEYKEYSFGPVRPYQQVMGDFLPNLAPFYKTPTDFTIEPFRIFGNL